MVSVIVPAYNEEAALPHTLEALLRQEGAYEVILVDGGSSDRTRTIAESFGFIDAAGHAHHPSESSPASGGRSVENPLPHRILTAPKGRASQMNAGAVAARGEWLLFLHADTVLPHGAIRRLNAMQSESTIQAGGFMHRFSGSDWRLKLISFLDNVRCRCSRVVYGDQALFVRRTLFERMGGFPDQPILEDVAFCERLITVTLPVLLSPPVVTDARKFVKMGIWQSFIRVLLIILHVEFRLPILPRAFFQDIR
ncbi:MAG: TIGR04283 family arsenosugar biosynthesis glycosyltransferase [Nitrospira sp.]|nr:TIGR04283 family arsenosugar biosynthesis glycosyltransferase [Nitrospira sp.]